MANNLTRQVAIADLMSDPPRLPMSAALYRAYEDTRRPHPDIGPPRGYSAEVKEEAGRALSAIAPYAHTPSEDLVKMWLQPIPFAVRNMKTEEEMVGWIHAVMLAAASLPCGSFTAETQRAALHRFKLFPSVADIVELLSEQTKEIRDKAFVLRRIAGG